jgi:hypothetical protein
MNRREALILLSALPVLGLAQGLGDVLNAVQDPLIGMLTAKLGISDHQAKGGMGSMLSLAKEKIPAAEFSKLTSLLPTATGYIDTANQLGAVAGPLKNMTGLNGAFSTLGMKVETAKHFVPTATDYVGKIGGEVLKNMLLDALK